MTKYEKLCSDYLKLKFYSERITDQNKNLLAENIRLKQEIEAKTKNIRLNRLIKIIRRLLLFKKF